jgi:hypothetical protein
MYNAMSSFGLKSSWNKRIVLGVCPWCFTAPGVSVSRSSVKLIPECSNPCGTCMPFENFCRLCMLNQLPGKVLDFKIVVRTVGWIQVSSMRFMNTEPFFRYLDIDRYTYRDRS